MSNNKIEISVKDIPIVVEELEKANAEIEQLNNIIDKAREYIEKDYYSKNTFDIDNIGMTTNKLLQVRNILKEVSE